MSEFHGIGRSEAVAILMKMMDERTRTQDEVTALQMAALRIMNKEAQRQRNWARRREANKEAKEIGCEVASCEVSDVVEGGVA